MPRPRGIVVSVCCLLLLAGCGASPVRDASGPTRPTASPGPTGREVLALPAQDQEYVVLDAGRYAVPLPPFWATDVDVPDQWSVHDGHYLSSGPLGPGNARFFVHAAPPGTGIPADPCFDHTYRRVGDSAQALARALARQQYLSTTTAWETYLGGHPAYALRLSVPAGADVRTCEQGQVDLYSVGGPEDAWVLWRRGIARLWVVDLDGERYVVHAETGSAGTPADDAVLDTMVRSMSFVRRG